MTTTGLTFERMRLDIAEVLAEDVSVVVPGENLVDLGIDSIRIMTLAERWSRPGHRVDFDDLASYPELQRWWDMVSGTPAGGE